MTTTEFDRRFAQRCADLGLDALRVAQVALRYNNGRDYAVRILELPWYVGVPWSKQLNGDELWVVVRDGHVITIFFRAHTQPTTPEALRVSEVYFANCSISELSVGVLPFDEASVFDEIDDAA